MKIGLVTDVHEQVEPLRRALDCFQRHQVEQVVVIGDLFLDGERIEETCRLLAEAHAIGVWGNHDYGLCVDPDDEIRETFSAAVIEYMGALQPRLDVAGCYFSHVEPWLNPEEITDLWYFEGPPDEQSKLDRIFDAVPNQIILAGHYHKWLLATPDGLHDWQGESPIRFLSGERYFVVVGAICEGRYAILDTETSVLVPFNEK